MLGAHLNPRRTFPSPTVGDSAYRGRASPQVWRSSDLGRVAPERTLHPYPNATTHSASEVSRTWRSNHCWLYNDVAPAFFLAAQRAFASADNFFRAAGLIGFRAAAFLAGAAAFVGADLPFRFAHTRFIASPMRLRASALIVRFCGADCGDCALGGRPRRGRDEEYDPSRATIA